MKIQLVKSDTAQNNAHLQYHNITAVSGESDRIEQKEIRTWIHY